MNRSLFCSKKENCFWGDDDQSAEIRKSFAEIVAKTPNVPFSTFGEPGSYCLDILSLLHNAVRQEMCDMYFLYRSMLDLQNSLVLDDVKASALWFRTFLKFLHRNVLSWHDEVYFGWFSSKVPLMENELQILREIQVKLGRVTAMSTTLYRKQARLSAELSGEAKVELLQVQLLDILCSSYELNQALLKYFRELESFTAPLLRRSGVSEEDRDSIFRQISNRIFKAGYSCIDLPMLIRWMPHRMVRWWLKEFVVDCDGRSIPAWKYNKWQVEHFDEKHRQIVSDIVQRAKASQGVMA